jgi:Flp pilus assembly protein TadD
MNKPLRFSSAASLVVLGSVIAGCAAPQARVGAASHVGPKANEEVGLATRALAALNSNDIPAAIDFAERAVAKTPGEASFRALLGNAYFAGGRFRSAEQAYRDSLTLSPNQPQIVLKLALVQIAQGKNNQAVVGLDAARGMLDPSDYGLALALAGRPGEAIAVLDYAARQTNADATVRQNLALAHALAGDWNEARTIASQDVPAGQLDSRIQQWMQLAKPNHASDQVAALVGVTPAAVDVGQPVQLALKKGETQEAAAVPAPVPGQKPAPVVVEAVIPAPAPAPAPVVAAAVPPAPPPPRPTIVTMAANAYSEAKAAVAAVLPHSQAPAPKPAKPRFTTAVQRATPVRRGNSQAVVQLGAYGSTQRVLTAWNGQSRKFGALKAYLPMSARFSSPKGTFYRLSVRGFASVGEANSLCSAIRHQGGACFVRNFAGDAPVQFASR